MNAPADVSETAAIIAFASRPSSIASDTSPSSVSLAFSLVPSVLTASCLNAAPVATRPPKERLRVGPRPL